jgi:hypothetical protein
MLPCILRNHERGAIVQDAHRRECALLVIGVSGTGERSAIMRIGRAGFRVKVYNSPCRYRSLRNLYEFKPDRIRRPGLHTRMEDRRWLILSRVQS